MGSTELLIFLKGEEVMVEFAQEEISFEQVLQHIELYKVEEEEDSFFDEKIYFE